MHNDVVFSAGINWMCDITTDIIDISALTTTIIIIIIIIILFFILSFTVQSDAAGYVAILLPQFLSTHRQERKPLQIHIKHWYIVLYISVVVYLIWSNRNLHMKFSIEFTDRWHLCSETTVSVHLRYIPFLPLLLSSSHFLFLCQLGSLLRSLLTLQKIT